jgi:diguanylate cyclase (GGDEF)-like protein
MDTSPAIFKALGLINCAIFERLADGEFKSVYVIEPWLNQLIPEATVKEHFTYQYGCAYLNDFLFDAETFWSAGQEGKIQSGIWREQIKQQMLHLEASAAVINKSCYLLISNMQNEYQRQQQTLQVARELLITNDKIVAQHDHVFNRLASLLANFSDNKEQQGPLQQALQQTELGVAILDGNLKLLNSNAAIYQMFEISNHVSKQSPEKIILQLFENQYPEYERVLANNSSWSGELYWLNPPATGKWFKVSMHPICHSEKHLSFWMLSISDISQLKYLLKRNEKLSHFDVLTELPNRQNFWQQLNLKMKKGLAFYVLYIEIKQFKKINELHGHLVGDAVIKELALRLKATVSSNDILARIGGTEFALIMHNEDDFGPTTSLDHKICQQLASELMSAVSQPFFTEQGHQCEVGLNIGAAMYPVDADISEDLMKYADLAMFEAKKQQKSNLQFYSKALKEASHRRIELENALRRALEGHEFELYFQPMFDLRTGKITKAEALIRWNKPLEGIVAPDNFIPLAEQTGLIVPIGKWVIKETCAKLADLQADDLAIKLCINLSPRQVNDRQLLDFIINCIDTFSVSPQQLELELTEGVLVDNFIKVQYLLNEVRKLGISVSIDDFGTGYSSLSYLQKLPIDHLKIDRSFVKDLNENENDKALVLAVIAMAHSLKLDVIAEGVETSQQKDFLQLNHCNTAQGFLFSRPVPFTQLLTLLSAQKATFN